MLKFTDSAAISGVRMTDEGYLVTDAFTARTGVQRYLGSEVGKPEKPVVTVYRPADEVFHKDSVQSFSHVPVTMDHPTEAVTADNWKQLGKGEASTEVMRDGERLRIPLIVKDGSAIKQVKDGKRELSVGYSCDLDWTAGITTDGVPYDAVQRNIRANHIAIVDRGRAGPEFRIGDSDAKHWGIAPIPEVKLQLDKEKVMGTKVVLVDGLQVETTDAGAIAIEKLMKDRDVAVAAQKSLADATKTAIEAKDTEIGELKAKLKQAQDSTPTGATLDKLVADRALLVSKATKLVKDFKAAGLTDSEIKKQVVQKVLGDDAVKDASEAEIAGAFKVLDAKGASLSDGLRESFVNGNPIIAADADKVVTDAYAEMIKDIQNGGKKAA
jgi:hypothetical protein